MGPLDGVVILLNFSWYLLMIVSNKRLPTLNFPLDNLYASFENCLFDRYPHTYNYSRPVDMPRALEGLVLPSTV